MNLLELFAYLFTHAKIYLLLMPLIMVLMVYILLLVFSLKGRTFIMEHLFHAQIPRFYVLLGSTAVAMFTMVILVAVLDGVRRGAF